MFCVFLPHITPEENMAADEYLLRRAEAGEVGESLRFWESREYFVVLGRSCKMEDGCRMDEVRRDGVKVLRRISGGGTVLQGPGCLNYSLVLSYGSSPAYKDIRQSYSSILGGIAGKLVKKGIAAKILPLSDLAAGDRKFSGNAQARRKKFFLHHGTLLYDMKLAKVRTYLKHPPSEPEYRRGRSHEEFISNIPLSRKDLEEAIKEAFPVTGVHRVSLGGRHELAELARAKYSSESWTFQF